jgi:hypothetical protein
MPITPLSKPLKTEYKPLGLEAFAQPLSQMQAKFDVAKSQIEDADYKINRLNWAEGEEEAAKGLINDYNTQASDLAGKLMRSGNYREAGSALKGINKKYNNDPQIQALQSNSTKYNNLSTKTQEAVEAGNMTPGYRQTLLSIAQSKFKGTNFDTKTGEYNAIQIPTYQNDILVEEKIQKLAIKIGDKSAKQQQEMLQNAGVVGIESKFRTGDNLQTLDTHEIENILRNSTEFKQYSNQKTEFEFFNQNQASINNYKNNLSESPFDFADSLIASGIEEVDSALEAIVENTDDASNKEREELNKIKEQLLSAEENKVENPEAYFQQAEAVYKNINSDYLDRVAGTTSDVFDYVKQTIDPSGKNKAIKETKDKAELVGKVISVAEKSKGGGNNVIKNTHQSGELRKENGIAVSAIDGLQEVERKADGIDNKASIIDNSEESKQQALIARSKIATKNPINIVDDKIEVFTKLTEDTNKAREGNKDKIADLKKELGTVTAPEDKKFIENKIKILEQDNIGLQLALTEDRKGLDDFTSVYIDGIKRDKGKLVETSVQGDENIKKQLTGQVKDINKILDLYNQSSGNSLVFLKAVQNLAKESVSKRADHEKIQQRKIGGINSVAKNAEDYLFNTVLNTTEGTVNSKALQKYNVLAGTQFTESQILKYYREKHPEEYTESGRRKGKRIFQDKYDMTSTPKFSGIDENVVNKIEESFSNFKQNYDLQIDAKEVTDNPNIFLKVNTNILQGYEDLNTINNPQYAVSQDVIMDNKSIEELSKGESTSLKDILKNELQDHTLQYDLGSKKVTSRVQTTNVDERLYNLDGFKAVGTDEAGNTVYQIPRKLNLTDVINELKTGEKQFVVDDEDKKQNYDAADLNKVKEANPPFLYVTDGGMSINPVATAKESAAQLLVDLKENIQMGDSDSNKLADDMLNNYITLDLIDSKKRIYYTEIAGNIVENAKEGKVSSKLLPPATFHQTEKETIIPREDGSEVVVLAGSTVFNTVRINTDSNGKIYSTKILNIKLPNGEMERIEEPAEIMRGVSLPQQLRKLDMYYGTGEKEMVARYNADEPLFLDLAFPE